MRAVALWRSLALTCLAFVLALGVRAEAAPSAPGGLVAAYSFDGGSGSVLADASGNGHTGTISGAAWTSAGRHGGALGFDGVDDLVTVADAAALDLGTGMTLSAWVRPSANGSWRTVVTKEKSGNLVYGLFSNSDSNQPAAITTIGANYDQEITRGSGALPLNTWTHLASTYDGSSLRLYVNGSQVATRPVSGAMANSSGPLQIGGNTVWPEWFQGRLDDLRIYNRALTPAELSNDMNTPVTSTTDTQAPTAPTGLSAGGQTQTAITLSWNGSSDNVGVAGYGLYRDGTPVGTTGAGGRSYTFTGLACGRSYTLAVDAHDSAGNRSPRSSLTANTGACPPPPPPPPPGSGSANVWVDTNGGSCTRRPTPAAYDDDGACPSLGAAYQAAQAGDTILIAAGSYGRQIIPAGSKSLSIRNAPGTGPVLGTTSVHASNLTLAGVRIVRSDDPGASTATLEARGSNNLFDGVHVDSRNAPVRQGIYANGNNTTFRNGSSFNVVDEKAVLVGGSNVTFEHMDFHDVRVTHSSVHNECVYSLGPNLTVRNSHFWNCATMDLFITRGDWWGQPLYGNVTLENNIFEHTTNIAPGSWHHYSLGINGGVIQELRNWRVVNNTFETAVGGTAPAPGTLWANNIGSWSCHSGATFSHNVGKTCTATDKAVNPAASCGQPACPNPTTAAHGWRNPAAHDFHLTASSPAINHANPAYAPALDRDRNPRNGPPDAGAYEYR